MQETYNAWRDLDAGAPDETTWRGTSKEDRLLRRFTLLLRQVRDAARAEFADDAMKALRLHQMATQALSDDAFEQLRCAECLGETHIPEHAKPSWHRIGHPRPC